MMKNKRILFVFLLFASQTILVKTREQTILEALKALAFDLESKDPITHDDIKRKYRALSLIYHPDKNTGKSEERQKTSQERFKEINNAYNLLIDKKDLEISSAIKNEQQGREREERLRRQREEQQRRQKIEENNRRERDEVESKEFLERKKKELSFENEMNENLKSIREQFQPIYEEIFRRDKKARDAAEAQKKLEESETEDRSKAEKEYNQLLTKIKKEKIVADQNIAKKDEINNKIAMTKEFVLNEFDIFKHYRAAEWLKGGFPSRVYKGLQAYQEQIDFLKSLKNYNFPTLDKQTLLSEVNILLEQVTSELEKERHQLLVQALKLVDSLKF